MTSTPEPDDHPAAAPEPTAEPTPAPASSVDASSTSADVSPTSPDASATTPDAGHEAGAHDEAGVDEGPTRVMKSSGAESAADHTAEANAAGDAAQANAAGDAAEAKAAGDAARDDAEANAAADAADANAAGDAAADRNDGGASKVSSAEIGAAAVGSAEADPVEADAVRTEATGADARFEGADVSAGFAPASGGAASGFGAAAGFGAAVGDGAPPWTSTASNADGSSAGFGPPWAGYRPPPPPPGTSGFATRYGLVRPVHNRYIAGVCGAFARATNTDPVLWRVALPVLTVLGGFGILVYLLGWLLIPAEGDSASPIESLIGRGWSSTSKWVTVVLGIIAAAWIVTTFSSGIGWKIVVAAAIVGALVVLGGSRGGNAPRWSRRPVGPQPGPDPQGFGWYTASGQSAASTPAAAPTAGAANAGATNTRVGAASVSAFDPAGVVSTGATGPGPGTHDAAINDVTSGVASASGTGWPESTAWHSIPDVDDPAWQPPAYRPPFAPGGPYAQTDPYAPGAAYDPYAPTAAFTNIYDDPASPVEFPGLTPDAPPNPAPGGPPARRRQSTVARRVTLFATVLVVGLLGILDATNAMSVPAPAYFAAALATVGLGLVIGSLFGRVRGPIFLGIVLAIGLVVTSLTSAYHGGQITLRPTNFAELPTTYQGSVGQLTVDLRKLNFAGEDRMIDLKLSAGHILVELPPKVDAHVVAKVGAGDTMIFGQHDNSGVHAHVNVTDDGTDGPGGGQITINANIAFAGLVEVKR